MASVTGSLISVIIPALNEEATLGQTLDQFDRLAGRWEVIVADSGSDDRTVEIAREAGAIVVEAAPAGRGLAMNAGVERARGDVLLFLHADTLLPEHAHDLIVNELADPAVAATGFRLRMDRDEWRYCLLSPISVLRFRVQRTFFGDQAIAVGRRDFDALGGYREPVLMEDVELSRRIRKRGELRLLPAYVTTSARRFERDGVFRTLLLMSLFQAAYAIGVSADCLANWYRHARSAPEPAPETVENIELAELELRDECDRQVDLAANGQHGPVLLVFLRWLG